jgi:hypothetical protein
VNELDYGVDRNQLIPAWVRNEIMMERKGYDAKVHKE